MKKIFLLIFIFSLLFSCTSTKFIPYENAVVLDYSYLKEKGIYISESDNVDFSYEPISSIFIEVRGGEHVKNEKDKGRVVDGIYGDLATKKQKTTIDPNIASVRRIYEELQRLNANGIIGLKVQLLLPVPIDKDVYYGSGYAISGMAIKR